jgi:hypothetical protein
VEEERGMVEGIVIEVVNVVMILEEMIEFFVYRN